MATPSTLYPLPLFDQFETDPSKPIDHITTIRFPQPDHINAVRIRELDCRTAALQPAALLSFWLRLDAHSKTYRTFLASKDITVCGDEELRALGITEETAEAFRQVMTDRLAEKFYSANGTEIESGIYPDQTLCDALKMCGVKLPRPGQYLFPKNTEVHLKFLSEQDPSYDSLESSKDQLKTTLSFQTNCTPFPEERVLDFFLKKPKRYQSISGTLFYTPENFKEACQKVADATALVFSHFLREEAHPEGLPRLGDRKISSREVFRQAQITKAQINSFEKATSAYVMEQLFKSHENHLNFSMSGFCFTSMQSVLKRSGITASESLLFPTRYQWTVVRTDYLQKAELIKRDEVGEGEIEVRSDLYSEVREWDVQEAQEDARRSALRASSSPGQLPQQSSKSLMRTTQL